MTDDWIETAMRASNFEVDQMCALKGQVTLKRQVVIG